MSDWYKIPSSSRMTFSEYQANVRGMNIVFGAVLGFVLAETSQLPVIDFCIVLAISASMAVLILYLSSSPYKLFYAASTALGIYLLPTVMQEQLQIAPIPRLQPTLAVWAAMVLLVELIPHDAPERTDTKNKEED